MIKQTWMVNRELFTIIIKDKEVFYQDRKMLVPTRMIPLDDRMKKKILFSRNKIDPNLMMQFQLTKSEKEEYDKAIGEGINIEENLSKICKKDCMKNGAILQKEVKE